MTRFPRQKDIARSVRAFENDGSWYQSYWYDAPQPEPASSGVHIAVWFAVLAVGVFVAL